MMRRFFKFTMLFGAIIGSMGSCSKLDKVRPAAENMSAIKSLSVDIAAPTGATVNFTKTDC